MLTPSSNTALEPATSSLLASTPHVTAHFARFRVTEIALSADADAQFEMEPMLAAAGMLADARCDAICWSGTSGSWLGLDRDRRLCAAMRARTGIEATTASLSMLEAFGELRVRRYALVTPYTYDVQQRIVERYGVEGFECVAERHAGLSVNFDFAQVPDAAIEAMVRDVARERADAVVVLCTNMDASRLAAPLARETGIPVLDSIAVALWGALRIVHLQGAVDIPGFAHR